MNFADLYRASNASTAPHRAFSFLAKEVIAHHPRVGDVELYPCVLNEDVSLAHMTYEPDRSSAYGEPYDVAVIRFSKELNRCWRRAACTKELMHVFDDSAAQTSDKGKFLILMKELGTKNILPGDASAMLLAERWTEWMALLALCPQSIRSQYEAGYADKSIDDMAMATKLKIPAAMIPSVMGDYYWRALERLTGETAPAGARKGHP